jgi:hypothetical protein
MITILQGLAIHINTDSPNYRSRFVEHFGQEIVEIVRPDISIGGGSSNDWASAITELVSKVKTLMKPNILPLMESCFSTTSDLDKTVTDIAMLETMKAFFRLDTTGATATATTTIGTAATGSCTFADITSTTFVPIKLTGQIKLSNKYYQINSTKFVKKYCQNVLLLKVLMGTGYCFGPIQKL